VAGIWTKKGFLPSLIACRTHCGLYLSIVITSFGELKNFLNKIKKRI
jgi:hypothetical protein